MLQAKQGDTKMKVEHSQNAQNNFFNPIQVMKKHPVITALAVVAIYAAVSWYSGGQASGGQEAVNTLKDVAENRDDKVVFQSLRDLMPKLTEDEYILGAKEGTVGMFRFDPSKFGEKFLKRFFYVFKSNNGHCLVYNEVPIFYSFKSHATNPYSEDLLEVCSEGVEKLYKHMQMFV